MLIQYLKYRRITLFLYLFTVIFFPMVQYLNNLSMSSILYSVEIVSFLFFFSGLLDFRQFMKRHKELVNLKRDINIYNSKLPEASSQIEMDYQALLNTLYDKTNKEMGRLEKGYKEEIDYYTIWVHQIKTPIAAIRLILQNNNSFDQERFMLEEELFKVEQYVEMVLHYLRIETMNSDLVLHKIDIESILKTTIKKFSTVFIHKRLKLEYVSETCTVLTDEKWLAFLMEQILSNALKYTNSGSIKIYTDVVNINTSELELNDRKSHQCLVIEDTGIGIRNEDIERIFEKGFTGYNGRLDKKSSGIGLYLCNKVANKIAHQIQIESEVSKGTKVRIIFPNNDIEVY